MTIEEIKTPDDILQFMEENIRYGWLDINDEEHIGNLENVRRLYRTASIEESLEQNRNLCWTSKLNASSLRYSRYS